MDADGPEGAELSTSLIHLITPGDHFSPGTGSAIPTVVHGLSAATPVTEPRAMVLVAAGTYADRYASADVIEYVASRPWRAARYVDPALSIVGLPRTYARRQYGAALAGQAEWSPGVVLAHNAPEAITLVDSSRHVPVLYAHNELLRAYSPAATTRALEPAARILCVSTYLAERTVERLPAHLRGRVAVVRNGVDAALFRPARPRIRGDALHVLLVGRMVPEKGADVLVDAVRSLDRPDIRLTVVGSVGFDATAPLTPFEKRLRTIAAGSRSRIDFLPFQTRAAVVDLFRSADVVVVPSRWGEPSGLTALEGMAAGAAVIASRTGGIPELTGGAATLVPAGDARALADALSHLADDEQALTRAREQALAHAACNDWARARRDLADVLRPVTGG